MKKLSIFILVLMSISNVYAISEKNGKCDKQYASSDAVAAVEGADNKAAAKVKTKTKSGTGK